MNEQMNPRQHEKKKSNLPSVLLYVLGGLLVVAFFGYVIVRPLFIIFTMGSDYTDSNGAENFSLEVLGENNLIGEHESKMYMSGVFYEGEDSRIEGVLKDCDRDVCTVQAGIFDGVYTAQATKIEKDLLNLQLKSQVEAGNFEIFILIDDEVDQRIQANCEKEVVLEGIKGKTILVKIVGEGADFAFSVERNY